MSNTVDYIIVGFGIAGAILSYKLWKLNKSFIIYDAPAQQSASSISSGLINPITGRRFVKSWHFEELLPSLRATYKDLESDLNISLLKEVDIHRSLFTVKDENLWGTISLNEPNYCTTNQFDSSNWTDIIAHNKRMGTIKAYRINVQLLIETLSNLYRSNIISDFFDYKELHITSSEVEYKSNKAKTVIFCEGHYVKYNPFFANLPMEPVKGEVLYVRIPNFASTSILKDKVYLVPIGNDTFWVGSTYAWENLDNQPTEEKKAYMTEILDALLDVPYQILDHKAGVRPSSKQRQPIIAFHPQYLNLVAFNGLGTKGASLAPYFTDRLLDMI
jgi:glycine/D-amino acid oxidase-like deaminating enzyme